MSLSWERVIVLAAASLVAIACSSSVGNTPPPVPPCDAICQDEIAVRSIREGMKLVFNLTLQGKPVGPQDATVPCPLGGTAHVFGMATSNAVQGATNVDLTYVLDHCAYVQKDLTPKENYALTVNGTISQKGTIAVQPSATTALVMTADPIDVSGKVYDPAVDYGVAACKLGLSQDGNQISGELCGRTVGLSL
ncbi:hypothetical protein BH09MYX1_BH09MYX1_47690 [soil metagenome]